MKVESEKREVGVKSDKEIVYKKRLKPRIMYNTGQKGMRVQDAGKSRQSRLQMEQKRDTRITFLRINFLEQKNQLGMVHSARKFPRCRPKAGGDWLAEQLEGRSWVLGGDPTREETATARPG